MKTTKTKIVPLEWNEAKQLEALVNSAANSGQALVMEPNEGVSRALPPEFVSPNQNLNGSVRFGTHYGS